MKRFKPLLPIGSIFDTWYRYVWLRWWRRRFIRDVRTRGRSLLEQGGPDSNWFGTFYCRAPIPPVTSPEERERAVLSLLAGEVVRDYQKTEGRIAAEQSLQRARRLSSSRPAMVQDPELLLTVRSIQDLLAQTLKDFRDKVPLVASAAPITGDLHALDEMDPFQLTARESSNESQQTQDEDDEGQAYTEGLGGLPSDLTVLERLKVSFRTETQQLLGDPIAVRGVQAIARGLQAYIIEEQELDRHCHCRQLAATTKPHLESQSGRACAPGGGLDGQNPAERTEDFPRFNDYP